LFPELEPENLPDFGEHVVTASSKLIVLDLLLTKILADREKVIIFSQFTTMLDVLEDYCTLREHSIVRIDGSTSSEEREEVIESFQKDPSVSIALISTRAGGLGITLTAASNVVFYDSDWNPQMDLQAIARAHRIG
jgi:SNF2 family DNA or RNA helicase